MQTQQSQATAPSIEEAIEQTRQHGQTAAQFQHTDPGDFIRSAKAQARASLDTSRENNRGPDGIEPIDLSEVHPSMAHAARASMSSPIRRAINRVGAVFPALLARASVLEQEVVAELTLEFWKMRDEASAFVPGKSPAPPSYLSAGDMVTSMGSVSSGGTVDNGVSLSNVGSLTGSGIVAPGAGTIASSGTIDQGGTTAGSGGTVTSSGSVTSAASVDSAGTVINAGTVENAGTTG